MLKQVQHQVGWRSLHSVDLVHPTCGAGEVAGGSVERPVAGRAAAGPCPPPPPALAPLMFVLKDACTICAL